MTVTDIELGSTKLRRRALRGFALALLIVAAGVRLTLPEYWLDTPTSVRLLWGFAILALWACGRLVKRPVSR